MGEDGPKQAAEPAVIDLIASDDVVRPGLGHVLFGPRSGREPSFRGILRVIVTVVASVFALYVVYRLRTPLVFLFMATFVAVAISGPVAFLSRHMPKGLAIVTVYVGLIMIPILIGAVLVPPAVRAASDLVSNFPSYVGDLRDTINQNKQLQDLNANFDITGKLEDFAADAASKLDDAAGLLADLGAGLVGSIFALVTILILSMFMVGRGGSWIDRALRSRPREEAEVIKRALDRMAIAVGGYVGGALLQATIAGLAAFLMLSVLGVPSALALAVIVAVLDLIPLVGATLGAILVGLVTLFTDFPTVTIIWVIFAIVYQQFENYVIQPRIQGRAVQLDPFIIVIAALFGGALLGIVGALIAIPVAAAGQIGAREFLSYRGMTIRRQLEQARQSEGSEPGDGADEPGGGGEGDAPPGGPDPAPA